MGTKEPPNANTFSLNRPPNDEPVLSPHPQFSLNINRIKNALILIAVDTIILLLLLRVPFPISFQQTFQSYSPPKNHDPQFN